MLMPSLGGSQNKQKACKCKISKLTTNRKGKFNVTIFHLLNCHKLLKVQIWWCYVEISHSRRKY